MDSKELTDLAYNFDMFKFLTLLINGEIPKELEELYIAEYVDEINKKQFSKKLRWDFNFFENLFQKYNFYIDVKPSQQEILLLFLVKTLPYFERDSPEYVQTIGQIGNIIRYYKVSHVFKDIYPYCDYLTEDILTYLLGFNKELTVSVKEATTLYISETVEKPFTSKEFYDWMLLLSERYPDSPINIIRVNKTNFKLYKATLKQAKKLYKISKQIYITQVITWGFGYTTTGKPPVISWVNKYEQSLTPDDSDIFQFFLQAFHELSNRKDYRVIQKNYISFKFFSYMYKDIIFIDPNDTRISLVKLRDSGIIM